MAVASEQNAGQRLVIWGTDVNVGTCKEKFQVAPNDRLRRAVIIARYKPTFSHRLSSDCEVSLCVCFLAAVPAAIYRPYITGG